MKTPRPRILVLAVCAALASCVTTPKPQALPSARLNGALAPPLLGGLYTQCLGSPMHASMLITNDASDEVRQKAYFVSYTGAFLDVKGQAEYVACLEKDTSSKDYLEHHKDALKWLKSSQSNLEKYQAFFPPEKRLVAVNDSYSDIDEHTGSVHEIVTLQDGSKVVSDRTFKKFPR